MSVHRHVQTSSIDQFVSGKCNVDVHNFRASYAPDGCSQVLLFVKLASCRPSSIDNFEVTGKDFYHT